MFTPAQRGQRGEGRRKRSHHGPALRFGLCSFSSPTEVALISLLNPHCTGGESGGGRERRCGSSLKSSNSPWVAWFGHWATFLSYFFHVMGWSMSAGRGERKKIKYVKVCRGTLCPCSLCVCDRAAALTLYPPSDPTLPRLALHPHGAPFSVHDMLLSCPALLYSQFNFSFTEDVCQRLHLSKQMGYRIWQLGGAVGASLTLHTRTPKGCVMSPWSQSSAILSNTGRFMQVGSRIYSIYPRLVFLKVLNHL